jgi:hypothetical protein
MSGGIMQRKTVEEMIQEVSKRIQVKKKQLFRFVLSLKNA